MMEGVELDEAAVVVIAGPATAPFRKQHQRHAPVLGDIEDLVGLPVVVNALCSGEDGVVVGHHGDAGGGGVEHVPVHAADAGDEAIGRAAGQQIVESPPMTLRRDDQGAVLDERARVDQVIDILARGPMVGLVAALDGIRPVVVARQGPTLQHLGQIRANGIEVELIRAARGMRRNLGRFERAAAGFPRGFHPARHEWPGRRRQRSP